MVANDSKLGGSLGKYAVQKLGAKRIAVLIWAYELRRQTATTGMTFFNRIAGV